MYLLMCSFVMLQDMWTLLVFWSSKSSDKNSCDHVCFGIWFELSDKRAIMSNFKMQGEAIWCDGVTVQFWLWTFAPCDPPSPSLPLFPRMVWAKITDTLWGNLWTEHFSIGKNMSVCHQTHIQKKRSISISISVCPVWRCVSTKLAQRLRAGANGSPASKITNTPSKKSQNYLVYCPCCILLSGKQVVNTSKSRQGFEELQKFAQLTTWNSISEVL